MKKTFLLTLLGIFTTVSAFCAEPTLTYIGHASMKIKTAEGVVIYIDPYAPGDYKEKADIILVTHGHDDHSQVKLVKKKKSTKIITYNELHPSMKEYLSVTELGVNIKAVPAENANHARRNCVGFVLEFDGIKIYHAGDTSYIDDMLELAKENITYAFFPTDGYFNMNARLATKCANAVAAKYSIPIHTNSVKFAVQLPQEKVFATFTPEGRMWIPQGDTITLKP